MGAGERQLDGNEVTMRPGIYEADCSDLRVIIHRVHYRTDEYIKAKISIYHKIYGYRYETKGHKLYLKNIKHWRRV